MTLPGFSAGLSLYRSALRYCLSAAHDQAGGVILQELPSQTPSSDLTIGPFPHLLCEPCLLDPILGCAKQCVSCPGPVPDERCTPIRLPCPASDCCPPGQGPCYLSGASKFCCQPGQSCCNPEKSFCCPQGWSCCDPENKVCCPPGATCCFGTCVDVSSDPQNCGSCRSACSQGLTCVNGQCVCPILDDPDSCGPGGRTSNSNYYFANNCQPITGLTISLTASEPIVSSNGFTVQLNANSQQGVDSTQQYVFLIQGNSIKGQITNWQSASVAIVCDAVDVAPTPINNGIPEGYSLKITLQYEGNSVSGALFEVLSAGLPVGTPQKFLVSQAGCNCSDLQQQCPPSQPGQFCCSGYQSSADLSPITAFQVNIVGPGGGAPTTLSGAGDIQYSVSSGALTPLSSPPLCIELPFCTNETSNASYGQLLGCPEQSFTQSFSTPIAH